MADTKRVMDRKFVPEPYDMDTMLGTNNSGVLMFPPYLEDTDTVSAVISGEGGSDAPVFNAQDSVLWNNLRDAFRDQITAMYKELRTGNKWNAKYVAEYFDEMQSKWPEAMFNEDGKTKYLIPLIDPVTVDEDTGELIRTDRYLTMLQGSKAMQRLWWLYNRFRYMDSKYNTGDAARTINLRLFNGGTLTLTPAIDLYVGVSFGGGTTPALKRTKAEQPQTFEYVAPSGVTEMETWIYSADLITDLGDLSVFYPNEIDVSRASRLRTLNIGSLAEGYSNSNLTTINASNNPLLEYINCANCPRLAISPNLEKSVRLKEAYFEGSGVTGIELADGCTIEKLHLPASVTSLILTNLNKLTDLQIEDMSNITRVMLSNMSADIIDPMTVLESIPAGSQVYIDGLDITLANDTELQEFIDFLDTMRGVTRERSAKGEWLYHDQETAQINGVIHVDTTTGAMARQLKDKYPYITLDFKHISCTVTFHNYNGTSVLQTKTSNDGAAVTYTGSTPTKPQSASHTFTFSGWAYQIDGVKNDNALKNVTEDRDLYPAFTATIRTFTVTFKNYNNTTLQTVNNVPYGSNAEYTGSTPTNNSSGDTADFEFIGWSPEPINIVGATTCVAQFKDVSSIVLKLLNGTLTEVDDSDELIENVGTFAFAYLPNLTNVNLPVAKSIEANAFYESKALSNLTLPVCDTIVRTSFSKTKFNTLSLPKITTLPDAAFSKDVEMYAKQVNLPLVETLPNYCFRQNTDLQYVDAPLVKNIRYYAFNGCNKLKSINFPLVESIEESAFASCTSVETINIDACTTLGSNAISGLSHVTEFQLKNIENVPSFTFSGWNNVTKIELFAVKKILADRVFQYCSLLETLIIRQSDTVAALSYSNAFSACPNVSIYVPDVLVEDYKEATNWSAYAANIKPLSEVQE